MTIEQICTVINIRATKYRIGHLQETRKRLKGLSRIPTSDIFNSSTIKDDWAFHVGGRTELQFNIGNEREGLRYGFAFSLDPSQTLPDPSILYPKILKLNSIISSSPSLFVDFRMWFWNKSGRSQIGDVKEITEDVIEENSFIFIGRIKQNPPIDEILETFDELFDIYISVENDNYLPLTKLRNTSNIGFSFKATKYNLTINKSLNIIARNTNVEIRHTLIQIELEKILISKYGKDNVAVEHPYQGNRVDMVVNENKKIYFYEVKVGDSVKSCIRQALGQLFEYSYFPDKNNATKLVVVGEPSLDNDAACYISKLNSDFLIPIEYMQVIV